jgi:hypothetical protein
MLDHPGQDDPLADPVGVHAVGFEQVAQIGSGGGAVQVDGAGVGLAHDVGDLGHGGGLPAHGAATEELVNAPGCSLTQGYPIDAATVRAVFEPAISSPTVDRVHVAPTSEGYETTGMALLTGRLSSGMDATLTP